MKLPFLQFYPADYMRDTRALSLAAKGGWVDVICMLHGSSTRGTMTLPVIGWARVMGASVDQAGAVVDELGMMGVCEVIRGGNGEVTISSRRMLRESITREQTRLRVEKHRRNAGVDTDGNAPVTGQKAETRSQKPETKKSDQSINPPPAAPSAADREAEIIAIYEAYPRKVGRADALRAISKAARVKTPALLLKAVESYATAVAAWSEVDRQFVPHPATWFNRGSYDDDPATWVRKSGERPPSEFASAF